MVEPEGGEGVMPSPVSFLDPWVVAQVSFSFLGLAVPMRAHPSLDSCGWRLPHGQFFEER